MSDLIERINNLGKIKKTQRDDAERAFVQSLKDKVMAINNLRKEAEELVGVCRALSDNKFDYHGENNCFMADTVRHRLGFTKTRYSDEFHLVVFGDEGINNWKIIFLCHGHDVEWGSSFVASSSESAGLLMDVLDSPTFKGHDLNAVRKFEPLLDEFLDQFNEFRNNYLAYAENLIKEA